MKDQCEIYDRECINCGECEICDLNPAKKCDNCGQCIEDNIEDYRSLTIQDFFKEHVSKQQVERINKKLIDKNKDKK